MEYTQLVGVANDLKDVAQDFLEESKQLGWYLISQCLQFIDADICESSFFLNTLIYSSLEVITLFVGDPCACRNEIPEEGELGKV